MWVTCYTDASWDQRERKGGWAYMIRSELGWFKKNGPTPRWVTCNNSAEMSAIVAGVYRAIREWPGTQGVGVRTDSEIAIHYLRYYPYDKEFRRQDWVRIRRLLYGVLDEHECRIRFVHVKGHQPRHASDQAKLNGNVDYWARHGRLGTKLVDQSSDDFERRHDFRREFRYDPSYHDDYDLYLEPPH